MSMVQQAIEVSAPLHAVYEKLAAFENYPRFMTGVEQVTSVGDDRTHWVMEVGGRRREFEAQIIERSLDQRVSWATTAGPRLVETITLRPMGETRTQVVAQLEADIGFLVPGDRHGQATLNRRLKGDLATFKALIENGADATRRPARSDADLSRGAALGMGTAPMGGRTSAGDIWGDGMINEVSRGSAHDH